MKIPDAKALTLIGLGFLLPALAARATRTLTGKGYKLITHRDPPRNPANPEVEWRDALMWAAFSGMLGGVARLSARRWLAETIIPTEGDDMEEEIEDLA